MLKMADEYLNQEMAGNFKTIKMVFGPQIKLKLARPSTLRYHDRFVS